VLDEYITQWYILAVNSPARIFKTAWFAKAARKAHIPDAELLRVVKEAIDGQVTDMGGGVFKKRLNRNEHRAIILSKHGDCWVFQHLFAKKDQANISASDLMMLRRLTKEYAALSGVQMQQLLDDQHWTEISCELKI